MPKNLAALFVLLAVAAACQPAPTPAPAVTAVPVTPGPMTLVDGCDPKDLDNWIEEAMYLTEAFGTAMAQAQEMAPAELDAVMLNLRDYKYYMEQLPVPADCAQEAHGLISAQMQEVISALAAYQTDPSIDIRPVITRAQSTLELAQSYIQELIMQMEATYEAGRR